MRDYSVPVIIAVAAFAAQAALVGAWVFKALKATAR